MDAGPSDAMIFDLMMGHTQVEFQSIALLPGHKQYWVQYAPVRIEKKKKRTSLSSLLGIGRLAQSRTVRSTPIKLCERALNHSSRSSHFLSSRSLHNRQMGSSANGPLDQTASRAGGSGPPVDKGVDFANYFCTYAFLFHQKEMLSDRVRMDAYYNSIFQNQIHFRNKV